MRNLLALPLLLACTLTLAQDMDKENPPEETAPIPESRFHLVLDTGGHSAVPTALVFTPDGKKLISASLDQTIQVWDVPTRQRLRVIHVPVGLDQQGGILTEGVGQPLVVDPQGEQVAFCVGVKTPRDKAPKGKKDKLPADKVVQTTFVCALATGQVQALKGAGPRAFTADGKALIIAEGKEVRLVDIATNQTSRTGKSKQEIGFLACSPDGKKLAASNGHQQVALFDVETLQVSKTLKAIQHLHNAAWADNKTVVCRDFVQGKNDSLVVLDAETGTVKHHLGHKELHGANKIVASGLRDVQALPGTKALVQFVRQVGARINKHVMTAYLIDWSTGQLSPAFSQQSDLLAHCDAIAVAPDLSLAAVGDGIRNDIFLWDPKTGQPLPAGKDSQEVLRLGPAVYGARGRFHSIRWAPEGRAIAWENIAGSVDQGCSRLDLSALELTTIRPEELRGYPRSIERQQGPVSLKRGKGNGVEVHAEGKAPFKCLGSGGGIQMSSREWVDEAYAFVGGERVAAYSWNATQMAVFDLEGKRQHLTRIGRSRIEGFAVSPKPECRYLLIGSADHTLTVFNPKTGKVLLTIYPAGMEWIAWTPQGYYAASPGGEKLMGWHVENGPDQLATFYPAQRFRKQLYRPDVIKLVLEKGGVEEALEAVGGKAQDIEQILPPWTILKHRQDRSTVNVQVVAHAGSKGQPIKELQLLVDGRPARLEAGPAVKTFDTPLEKDAKGEWNLTLEPGPHRLSVRATAPDTYSISQEINLVVPVPTVTPPKSNKGTLHYLGIGVNQFKHEPELKLTGAVPDVLALEKCLTKQCAGRFEVKTTLLTDERATLSAILQALTEPQGKLKPTDVVIVHYSSHGEIEDGGLYLLCHDSKRGHLKETAVSGDRLRDVLGGYPCPVLLILDACHSGKFPLMRSATDPLSRLLADDSCGVAVMAAALAHQKAMDTETGGVFTQALVAGIEGKARPDEFSKRLFVHNVFMYVYGAVTSKTENRQMPLYLPSGSVPPIVLKEEARK